MSDETKRSKIEVIKEESNYLRGTLGEALAADSTHFSEADVQLLKFHGTYEQDDRDARKALGAQGKERAYAFMVRMRIPGGVVGRNELLTALDLCDRYGNGTVRITTRQGFQLHGVFKKDLKQSIRAINETLLTTLGACGDVERNVMCCPAPIDDVAHRVALDAACAIAARFAPRSGAYHEIWLDGEKIKLDSGATEEEPIYGKTYLPRKFKTGVAVPGDNCIDVYTNDLGFIPVLEDATLVGYNVLVGGGQGMTTANPNTFPRLADPLGFCPAADLVPVAEAVVTAQRDLGNRTKRHHARLKYLIHDRGIDWFRSEVEQRYGKAFEPFREVEWNDPQDHLGWHEQGGGLRFFGVFIENGRIQDVGTYRLKSALRQIAEEVEVTFRNTPQQNLLICDVSESDRARIDAILAEHGVRGIEQISVARRNAMACPALPTCGLALTEAERALPDLIDELERELAALGLAEEVFSIRMTGCPNGCARPYNGELAFVGRVPGKIDVYVGADKQGTRLNEILIEKVPMEKLVSTLVPIFRCFVGERNTGEGFGDFCHRVGLERLRAVWV